MSTAKKMKMKMATKADWSGLDDLALEDITGRMTLYQDFTALRMVCTSWRSSLQDFKFKFCRMPWLMIPPKYGTYLREFFIFPHVEEQGGMITQQHLVLPDPDPNPETRILSHVSSKGWLISIERRSLSTNLLHPFSGAQIKVPPWPREIMFVTKFVLSSNPLFTLNYTVMILHNFGIRGELTYSKSGDTVWTTLNKCGNEFFDLTYHEGKFYLLNMRFQIMSCDVTEDNPTMAQVANMPEVLVREMSRAYAFIVECSRRLLVVTQRELYLRRGRRGRRSRETNYGTYEFLVFEVDLSTNNWTVMKDLGNKTLFLGGNSSICMESDGVYFKPNRIYFIDNYMDAASFFRESGGQHVRVYNIEDGSIDPYFLGDSCDRLTPSYRVRLARRWDRTTWDGTGLDGTGHIVLYCVWKVWDRTVNCTVMRLVWLEHDGTRGSNDQIAQLSFFFCERLILSFLLF